jgi:hypothetical protein
MPVVVSLAVSQSTSGHSIAAFVVGAGACAATGIGQREARNHPEYYRPIKHAFLPRKILI